MKAHLLSMVVEKNTKGIVGVRERERDLRL
jgi:hypothetical protein